MALDGRRTKAAALLGGGVPANRVAAEVGISARQLRRWRKEPDFAALESASRGDVLAGSRTLRNVLEAALVAVTPKGAPDWSARLKAAHLLLSSAAVLEELEGGPARADRQADELVSPGDGLDGLDLGDLTSEERRAALRVLARERDRQLQRKMEERIRAARAKAQPPVFMVARAGGTFEQQPPGPIPEGAQITFVVPGEPARVKRSEPDEPADLHR